MSLLALWNAYREQTIKLSHAETLCAIELKGALASVDALEVAGRKGHDVGEALDKARERIIDLKTRMPRGHGLSLGALTVLTILLTLLVIFALPRVHPSPEDGAVGKPARLWRALGSAGTTLSGAPWIPILAALYVLVMAFLLQRKLRRRHARAVFLASMGAEVAVFLFLVLARLLVTRGG